MDNIILIGMPGSGKSTVGVLLAKALGYGFLDTDLVIQQREGLLLQDILDQFGVKHFLQVEEEAIRTVDCRRTVIAPGGSAVCREGTMAHLKELGPVVYLRVPMEELTSRIQNLATRADPGGRAGPARPPLRALCRFDGGLPSWADLGPDHSDGPGPSERPPVIPAARPSPRGNGGPARP